MKGVCKKIFKVYKSSELSEDNSINIKMFKCMYVNCEKSFKKKSRLEIHKRTHVNK